MMEEYTWEDAKNLAKNTTLIPNKRKELSSSILSKNDQKEDDLLKLVMDTIINHYNLPPRPHIFICNADFYDIHLNYINYKYILLKEMEKIHGSVYKIYIKYRVLKGYVGGKYRMRYVEEKIYCIGDIRDTINRSLKKLHTGNVLWNSHDCPPTVKIKKLRVYKSRDYFPEWWNQTTANFIKEWLNYKKISYMKDKKFFNKERWKWVNAGLTEKNKL